MKTTVLVIAVLTSFVSGYAAGAVVLQAAVDSRGQHEAVIDTGGPVTVTCTGVLQSAPTQANSPQPACHVTAPGFVGLLYKTQSTKTTAAGKVTLECVGDGNVACNATVQ